MNPYPAARPAVGDCVYVLVAIDRRMARIYKADLHDTLHGCIIPYDANGLGRHLHYVNDEFNEQQQPERERFYDAVATTLQSAKQILLFGIGTGASSAVEQLFTELKRNHQELSRHIVGSIVVSERYLTENQLLARVRDFCASQKMTQPGRIYETLN